MKCSKRIRQNRYLGDTQSSSQRSSDKCFNSQRLINKGRDIKVGIYDDIVNIVSPGSFPNTITATDIDNGRSEARNKVIENVIMKLF